MAKKLCVGMLVIVLAFGITVVGCDDGSTDDNDKKTVTFSLNKVNYRTFTVTVDGAKWKNVSHVTPSLLADSNFSVTFTGGTISSILWSNIFPHPTGITRTSDTVFTYTLGDSWQSATGTISFKANLDGASVTDGGTSANYVVNTSRSSVSFP
jgi:hypothetical protein